jgi:hypothetical protein
MNPGWMRYADLVILVGCALIAFVAVLLNLDAIVRVILALPLVLFAPGYVLHEALFARAARPRLDQLVISLGASIAIAILTGLFLAAVGVALEPVSWTVALGLITVGGAVIAWRRRRTLPFEPSAADVPPMRRYEAFAIVVSLIAVLAIMVGTRLAVAGQEAAPPEQLWLLPARDGSLGAEVGMRADGDGGSYTIRLTSEGVLLEAFNVDLEPQQIWQTSVQFTEEQRRSPIVGRLYEESDDTELRFVVLQPPPDGE